MRTAKNTIYCCFNVVEEGIKYATRIYYLIARIQRSEEDKINQLGNWNNQVVKHTKYGFPSPSPGLQGYTEYSSHTVVAASIAQNTAQTKSMLIVVKIL